MDTNHLTPASTRSKTRLWLQQVSEQRAADYPNWQNWDAKEYFHYVVQGHDNYYEIIAAGFSEKQLPYEEAGELKRLVDEG